LARSAPTPAKPAIQTQEECAIEAQEVVELAAQVERIETERRAAHDTVDQEYAERLQVVKNLLTERLARVHAWAEANRDGRKTIVLPNERRLEWRLPSSPALQFSEEKFASIVRALLRLKNWSKYLKIELRKNEVKADLPELQKKSATMRRWVWLDRTEYFKVR
jgi:phage host-nuclease inhibitor protein Gam